MDLKRELLPPGQMLLANGQPDVASLIVLKALQALPRRTVFDLSELVNRWNHSNTGFVIRPNEDISSLADAILGYVPLQPMVNGVPVFTEFYGSYICQFCQHQQDNARWWALKPFNKIPIVSVTPAHANAPVSVGALLTDLIQAPINIHCSTCGVLNQGAMRVVRGKYTLVRINRFDNQGNVIRNRFTDVRTQLPGEQYLGQLISLVSHIDQRAHYVSYHQVGGQWYLNDDDNRFQRSPYHPYQSNTETVNLVLYRN